MRKGWLLGAALAGVLLCLPAWALGESWAEFATRVNAQLLEAEGEVVIQTFSPVEAYAVAAAEEAADDDGRAWPLPEDVPLVVPEGVSLVLEGGDFSGLLLGGGQLELRGVNLNGKAGQPAICLMEPPKGKGVALSLTIDDQSAVQGNGGPALAKVPGQKQAWDLTLENEGALRSDGGDAVSLRMAGAKGGALYLHNAGDIEGDQAVVLGADLTAAYRVAVLNEGTMSGREAGLVLADSGRQKENYVQVVNAPEGVVEVAAESGAPVALAAEGNGICQLVNEGTLRGGEGGLWVTFDVGSYQPLEIFNSGEVQTAEGAAPVRVILRQQVQKEAQLLDGEAFAGEAAAMLEAGGLSALPQDTAIQVTLDATVGTEFREGIQQATLSGAGAEAAPISWKAFLARVDTATRLAHGWVPIYLGAPVEAYQRADKPLVVAEDQCLVLRGCRFGGMLLGAGELVMEGVTVEAVGDAQPAIYIENKGKDTVLSLVLDEDTLVRAAGAEGTALGTWSKFTKPFSVSVVNFGRIESPQEYAVLLRAQASAKNAATVSFANYGDIEGEKAGLFLAAETANGPATVSLVNEGRAASASGYGAFARGNSENARVLVRVLNEQNGRMSSRGGNGLGLDIREGTKQLTYHESIAAVRNDGTIEGGTTALHAITLATHPMLLQLRGEGTWRAGEEQPIMTAAFHQWHRKARDEPLAQEDFERVSAAWLNLAGRAYLPEEFDIAARLVYLEAGKLVVEMYPETFSGGGEGMPDQGEEAANYDLPVFLRYSGDGLLGMPEYRRDALLLKRVSDYELRGGNTLWFLVGDEWVEAKDYQRFYAKEYPIVETRRGEAVYTNSEPAWIFELFASKQKKEPIAGTVPRGNNAYIELPRFVEYLQSLYPDATFRVEQDEQGRYHTTLAAFGQTITLPDENPAERFAGFWAEEDKPYDYQSYLEKDGQLYIDMNIAQFDMVALAALMEGSQPNYELLTAE